MYRNLREFPMKLTPNHIFFETSSPLTEQQLEKLNFFIDEILFDDEDLDNIPELTTNVEQFDSSLPKFNN